MKLIANIRMALAEAYYLVNNPHTTIVYKIVREGIPSRICETIAEIEAARLVSIKCLTGAAHRQRTHCPLRCQD